MTEDGADFGLEHSKAFLVTFHCLWVIPETDAALIGQNSYLIPVRSMESVIARHLGGFCKPYPSECSFCKVLGTLGCHQRQSVASLAKTLPDVVCIKVES